LNANNIYLKDSHYSSIHEVALREGFNSNKLVINGNKFIFSFVRNPFRRIVSLYRNKFLDLHNIHQTEGEYKTYLGGLFKQSDSFKLS